MRCHHYDGSSICGFAYVHNELLEALIIQCLAWLIQNQDFLITASCKGKGKPALLTPTEGQRMSLENITKVPPLSVMGGSVWTKFCPDGGVKETMRRVLWNNPHQ
jgi:hypothetical protein